MPRTFPCQTTQRQFEVIDKNWGDSVVFFCSIPQYWYVNSEYICEYLSIIKLELWRGNDAKRTEFRTLIDDATNSNNNKIACNEKKNRNLAILFILHVSVCGDDANDSFFCRLYVIVIASNLQTH